MYIYIYLACKLVIPSYKTSITLTNARKTVTSANGPLMGNMYILVIHPTNCKINSKCTMKPRFMG